MTGLSVFLLVAGTMAWALATPLVGLLASRLLQAGTPEVRMRRALLLALLPWAASLLSMAAMLALAWAKWTGWITDHCVHHGPGHPHLCLEHLPQVTPLSALLVALAALTLLGWRGFQCWHGARIARRQTDSLLALAAGRGLLRIVAHRHPAAFATGIRRPRVLLSTGLLDGLTPGERRVVVSHELTHLRHGDPLRAGLIDLLLVLHLPRHAARLRAAWRRAIEERTDDDVAGRFGHERTAATLLRVARMMSAPGWQLSAAGSDPVSRARRLLSDRPVPRTSLTFELSLALALLGAAAGVVTAHHPIETLLGLL